MIEPGKLEISITLIPTLMTTIGLKVRFREAVKAKKMDLKIDALRRHIRGSHLEWKGTGKRSMSMVSLGAIRVSE